MGAISDADRLREAIAAVQKQAEVFKETVTAASAHKARLESASQTAEVALRAMETAKRDATEATERLRSVHSQWGSLKSEMEKQAEATVREASRRLTEAESRLKNTEAQSRKDLDEVLASAREEIGAIRGLIDTLEKDFREHLHAATQAEAGASRSAIEEAALGARAASMQGIQEVERARKSAEDSISEGRKESARRLDAMEDFVRGRLADYQSAFQPLRDSQEALRGEVDRLFRALMNVEVRFKALNATVEAIKPELERRIDAAETSSLQRTKALENDVSSLALYGKRLLIALVLVAAIAIAALVFG